jgi:hypothetical protein
MLNIAVCAKRSIEYRLRVCRAHAHTHDLLRMNLTLLLDVRAYPCCCCAFLYIRDALLGICSRLRPA